MDILSSVEEFIIRLCRYWKRVPVADLGTRIGFSYSGPGISSFVWPRISRPPNKVLRKKFSWRNLLSSFTPWWLVEFAPPAVSASEMTYIVSSGALNSTHSLTHPPAVHRSAARGPKRKTFPPNFSKTVRPIVIILVPFNTARLREENSGICPSSLLAGGVGCLQVWPKIL